MVPGRRGAKIIALFMRGRFAYWQAMFSFDR
jgi:hypothetical protein